MSPTRRLGDYTRWHRLQVATGDIDPVYPVLRELVRAVGLERDGAAWLVLLHVTYYHLGSALAAFAARPTPGPPARRLLRLPTGVERRGHRDQRQMERHWHGLLELFAIHGGPYGWLTAAGNDWNQLNAHIARAVGNGRWAAYKTAELAQKVLGVSTVVADAGHRNSSGPRHGLDLLYPGLPRGNAQADIAVLDGVTSELAGRLGEVDIGQVETSLCDFASLVKGGYYLGHDIDAMQAQLMAVPSALTGEAFTARARTLPGAYLGEHRGREGVDRARKRIYLERGVIAVR